MEIVKSLLHRILKSDLSLLFLITLGWFGFLAVVEPPPAASSDMQSIFAIGAGLAAFIILARIGYFDSLKLVPRRSDMLLMLGAVPAGAIIHHTALEILFSTTVSPLRTVAGWSILVALFAFGLHYGGSTILLKSGRKRRVVLDLLPEERDEVINELVDIGKDPYFEILSTNDLKEHFLRAAEKEIDLIIISRGAVRQFEEDGLLVRAHLAGIPILDKAEVLTRLTGHVRILEGDLWSYLNNATPQTSFIRVFYFLKSILEPIVAGILALVLAPLMIILSIVIKATSPGPIFYRQIRTGYLGRSFTLVKFRSMRDDAESNGPQWASQNDNRVTQVGAFMRRTRLDELPQLWNVIRGDMGFVGPRPERPEIYRELKKEIPLFTMRTIVRPGITGWAQVTAGYAASVEESKTKLEYDLFYIQNMSPRLDLLIILRTLQVAMLGDSADKKRYEKRSEKKQLEQGASTAALAAVESST